VEFSRKEVQVRARFTWNIGIQRDMVEILNLPEPRTTACPGPRYPLNCKMTAISVWWKRFHASIEIGRQN
jgi:hypothetical protein